MFSFMSVLSNFERLITALRNHHPNAVIEHTVSTYRVESRSTFTIITLLQRPYGGVPWVKVGIVTTSFIETKL